MPMSNVLLQNKLRIACVEGDLKTVTEILETHPIYLNTKLKSLLYARGNGVPPLILAINNRQTALLHFLLKQPRVDVSIVSSTVTALNHALRAWNNFENADYNMAYTLIKAGADINQIANSYTVLLWAWRCKNQQAAATLILLFNASIEISEELFNANSKNKYDIDGIPHQIELSINNFEEIKNAQQLGVDMGRLSFLLHSDLDHKIATFLFKSHSLAMRAFEAGRTKIRERLTPPTPISCPLTFMRDFDNETLWQQWKQEHNARDPNHEKCRHSARL